MKEEVGNQTLTMTRPEMRIVCIADTHGYHRQVEIPQGDVLIFAGDYTARDSYAELADFADWIEYQPCEHRIVCVGNHDWVFEKAENPACEAFKKVAPTVKVLIDEEITIDGKKIYCSPWQPEFCDWAFNLPRGEELRDVWAKIPNDTDILVTHGPPAGILDSTVTGEIAGCVDLLNRVKEVNPKVHCFGHLHEARGIEKYWNTTFVNASICDFHYNPINEPIVIDIGGFDG